MEPTNHPLVTNYPLVKFLQDELSLPADSISLALNYSQHAPSQLPMVLWQYGLITLRQLEQIFDWLEGQNSNAA
ncbi:DUF2949 domain-containing protein [Alkalinema pantanalense CENA528]|uniref:DUF2949 domain-containing protein n=1 Tax=Alkalinema pantanalense TaxID=1620705 RepID=UPI003D6E31B1